MFTREMSAFFINCFFSSSKFHFGFDHTFPMRAHAQNARHAFHFFRTCGMNQPIINNANSSGILSFSLSLSLLVSLPLVHTILYLGFTIQNVFFGFSKILRYLFTQKWFSKNRVFFSRLSQFNLFVTRTRRSNDIRC